MTVVTIGVIVAVLGIVGLGMAIMLGLLLWDYYL